MEHTLEDLKELQSLPLSRKILITQTRIIEWYQRWTGGVYVSFSGGKDSTVLLDIVRKMYPDVEAVFCDTGLEYPEIRKFVRTFDNVTILRPKMSFRKVIETYGYPLISRNVAEAIHLARSKADGYAAQKFDPDSKYNIRYKGQYCLSKYKYLLDSNIPITAYCCNVMKKNPAKKYERETGKKPMLATMACESKYRRTAWLKSGCNAFDAVRPKSDPMSFWTEQDVLEYLRKYQIPYSSVYGEIVEDPKTGKLMTTGMQRTGCIFCGFGCHLEKEPNRFQRLKITHPQLWDYCMKPWDEGGLGMQEVLDFIHVKTGK